MNEKTISKQEKYKVVLQAWIDEVIENKLWIDYYDMHIDEIEPQMATNKNHWLDFSLFVFELLNELLNREDYKVILAIPLSHKTRKTEVASLNWIKLKNELSITPPSLYFFPKGEQNYNETINDSRYLTHLSEGKKLDIYYKEDFDHDMYNRVILVHNKRKN